MRLPSESTTLANPFIICPFSNVSVSGWLPSFLACHWNTSRTGFIDQSQARATRQAPSIRVLHAGQAAHYILHISHVLLWLAAYLLRMPLERRETQDWLRPGGPTCLRPNMTPHHIFNDGRLIIIKTTRHQMLMLIITCKYYKPYIMACFKKVSLVTLFVLPVHFSVFIFISPVSIST
uniref:Transmembrane protein n=1 Tax=Mesocestoides corti TaxID=53468 RepID=A0A5K3FX69_MESCO